MTKLNDRIISDLWKKYNRAKTDYGIATDEIESYRYSMHARIADREKAHYWLNFYKAELEKLGIDVDEE